MQCPKCGHNLPKNIVFCGKCGADLSKTKKKQKKGCRTFLMEEFCTYGGAEEILNEITSAGNTCTEILYRGNGLIHINFHSPEGFNENATLKLESGNVQLLSAYSDNPSENLLSSSYGGIYMAAMIPEIAVYP